MSLGRAAVLPLDSKALARRLGARARALADQLAGSEWSAERVQLVASGLFGARLLAMRALGERFDRCAVQRVFAGNPATLDATSCAALAAPAGSALSRGVNDMIELLARADAAGVVGHQALLRFYEPFLAAFAPAVRRAHGVYYTPCELAAYVVEQVDRTLERECGVPSGLAAVSGRAADSPFMLDPAAGTGAFLTALIFSVHARMRAQAAREQSSERKAADAWQRYVPAHLLPRLAGFDVMTTACALAHLQVRLSLMATGYLLCGDERIEVHVADALQLVTRLDEVHVADAGTPAGILARSNVIVGNPPYARGAGRRSESWEVLLGPYKRPMRAEKNLQPLADDYVRFVRLAEHVLARHPVAVLGFVTNSTFLHGHLHRAMRESLSRTFPRIDVLDLGGSAKRTARAAGDARDENVFNVAQGIAVTVMARAPRLSAAQRHAALRGRRVDKLAALRAPCSIAYVPLPRSPAQRFVPQPQVPEEYATFPELPSVFSRSSIGAKPGDDKHLVAFEREALVPQLDAFRNSLREDPRRARTEAARRVLAFDEAFDPARVLAYAYRPFDVRFVYEDARLWTRPVRRLRECLDGSPLLLTTRFAHDGPFAHVFCTRLLPDVIFLSNKSAVNCFAFPQNALSVAAARTLFSEPVEPEALFAYLYAVLHSPTYRARYAAGLCLGFPRVPLARTAALVDALSHEGRELIALHLGERAATGFSAARYHGGAGPVPRGMTALRELPSDGQGGRRIALGDTAYFDGVDPQTWEQHVGGYQTCRKWLLDRERAKRPLSRSELAGYANLMAALGETRSRMQAIDAAIDAAGGFPAAFHGAGRAA